MSEKNISDSLKRIALEIFVGFIGVYAAFALSAYKDQRDQVEKRHQIKRALIAEMTQIVDVAKRNQDYDVILAKFDSAVKAGKKPIPRAFIEPIGTAPHLWEATKAAGGLSLLDVATFVKVSDFYNNWAELGAFYGQLRDLSVNVIVPASGRGSDAFYDAKTGELRPEVRRIYYYDLVSLSRIAKRSLKSGTEVIAVLARDTI